MYDLKCFHSAVFPIGRARHQCIRVYICESKCSIHGSSVSYDAGKTWAHIDQTGSKAACRFYDANTGYAGGLHVSGHPTFGSRGMFKSQIVFEMPASTENARSGTAAKQPIVERDESITENSVHVYPTPARNFINVVLQEAIVSKDGHVSIHSLDGKLLKSTKLLGAISLQINVSSLPAGVYTLRITSKSQMINKMITIAK